MKENISLVQEFYTDVFINRDFSRCKEYMDENYINNSNFVDNGRDGFMEYFSNYSKKFPNGSASIEKILSSDDHVLVYANHWTKLLGLTLRYKAIDIYEIKNNKIKEHWDSVEGLNGISIFIFMVKRIFGL